eukprot:124053-Chlamydomonas_euryale.AAC.6
MQAEQEEQFKHIMDSERPPHLASRHGHAARPGSQRLGTCLERLGPVSCASYRVSAHSRLRGYPRMTGFMGDLAYPSCP